tara:strand:- start:178 stop:663 length:486 start_codon:yes stop_codon:yes gene_type:complete
MPVVRPGVIREEIVVDGHLESVFDFMTDFSNSHLWDPGVVRSVSEGKFERLMIGVGSSFDLTVKFNSSEMDMKYYIIEYKHPYQVVLYGEGKIIKAIDTIKFKRLDNNKVEIQYEADLTLKGWRRPFIFFINNSLNKLGNAAKCGIQSYFKFGNKNKYKQD